MSHLINKAVKVAVSGIPRGYHFPGEDGNWLQPHHKARIKAISGHIELLEIPAHELQSSSLDGVEVVLAEGGNRIHYPGELDWADYQHFFTPELKWLQLCSTGFSDNITPQILSGTTTLTNAPGLHTLPIAESVLAAMLDHAKNLKQRRLDQAAERWAQLQNDELTGRTVLIMGLGQIGQRVARLCHAFDMKVIGCKRFVEPVAQVDKVFALADLGQHLPEADYVVIALPLTPATEKVLGAAEFAMMKQTAYLINVGRGAVTDEEALIRSLATRDIAGAYLDALVLEPLPAGHPFWQLNNVLLVPHDSHSSPYIGDRMVDIFCTNLERYIAGQSLQHICDPKRGY